MPNTEPAPDPELSSNWKFSADPEVSVNSKSAVNPESSAAPEFVVEVDQAKLLRAQRRVLRLQSSSAWVSLVGSAMIAGLSVPLLYLSAYYLVPLMLLPALLFSYDGIRKLRRIRRARQLLGERGTASVAMRISAAGLRCGIDAVSDWIVLPWSALAGVRLHTYFGRQSLVLELAPGVGIDTPGVEGLDHPDVRAVLRRRVHGAIGPRYAVGVLRRSVPEISQALFHYSGGRVWVR